jgi:1-deoxy-D-xylulose-5-phosphate synthase
MSNNLELIKTIKTMELEELKVLVEQIRSQILDSVSKNGGHLASSLGAVELGVALHHVFDSPKDSIIWDVGHQAYAHKIITGRDISKIRTKDGVSGFPKPSESEHDLFVAGHAGVSVSEASGIASIKRDNYSIAVIGDGCMTSGVAYEAMNHAGSMKLGNLIVILNDNEMSISKNVGAIASFISGNIINTAYYQKIKSDVKSLLASMPFQKRFNVDLVELVKKIRSSAVNFIAPEAFFEAFGFHYVGPFDGHDLDVLIKAFRNIPLSNSEDPSPLLMHIVTKKGRGYTIAEESPCEFHGVPSFDTKTGTAKKKTELPSFTSVFGNTMVEIAEKNKKVFAITAAMKEGTGLQSFAEKFPDRFFDVGIAEQHAVSFSAGLAKAGSIPVVSIYSSFLQRSLDQVIHDIALNNLHVVMCLDRAGLVGEDGATHHGAYDISYLRPVPNLKIMAPSTALELQRMLRTSISDYDGPCVIRYPRGCVPDWDLNIEDENLIKPLELGKGRLVYENNTKKGKYIAVVAIGYSVYLAKLAAETLVKEDPQFSLKIYDARFIKPLDRDLILAESKSCSALITVEENSLAGGFGSAVLECILDNDKVCKIPFYRLGIVDKFIEHATQSEQRSQTKIDLDSLYKSIKSAYSKHVKKTVQDSVVL